MLCSNQGGQGTICGCGLGVWSGVCSLGGVGVCDLGVRFRGLDVVGVV